MAGRDPASPGMQTGSGQDRPFLQVPTPQLSPHTSICSSLYTKRYALTVVAFSFGPWLSLALFRLLGNQWHARDCRLVLGCGVAAMAAPLALMCFFDDDCTLPVVACLPARAPHAGGPSWQRSTVCRCTAR